MKMLSFITVALLLPMMAACATGYQSSGFTGGFKDTQLAPDVFRVSFSGNAFTSSDRVQRLCLAKSRRTDACQQRAVFRRDIFRPPITNRHACYAWLIAYIWNRFYIWKHWLLFWYDDLFCTSGPDLLQAWHRNDDSHFSDQAGRWCCV